MARIKLFLCLIVLGFANLEAKKIASKTPVKQFSVAPGWQAKRIRGWPSVVASNLPVSDQRDLTEELQDIYASVTDTYQRAAQFQSYLQHRYTNMRSSVVIGYSAVVYMQMYYITFKIENDYVLAFGL